MDINPKMQITKNGERCTSEHSTRQMKLKLWRELLLLPVMIMVSDRTYVGLRYVLTHLCSPGSDAQYDAREPERASSRSQAYDSQNDSDSDEYYRNVPSSHRDVDPDLEDENAHDDDAFAHRDANAHQEAIYYDSTNDDNVSETDTDETVSVAPSYEDEDEERTGIAHVVSDPELDSDEDGDERVGIAYASDSEDEDEAVGVAYGNDADSDASVSSGDEESAFDDYDNEDDDGGDFDDDDAYDDDDDDDYF